MRHTCRGHRRGRLGTDPRMRPWTVRGVGTLPTGKRAPQGYWGEDGLLRRHSQIRERDFRSPVWTSLWASRALRSVPETPSRRSPPVDSPRFVLQATPCHRGHGILRHLDAVSTPQRTRDVLHQNAGSASPHDEFSFPDLSIDMCVVLAPVIVKTCSDLSG